MRNLIGDSAGLIKYSRNFNIASAMSQSNFDDRGKVDQFNTLLINVKFLVVLPELSILRVPLMVMELQEVFCR